MIGPGTASSVSKSALAPAHPRDANGSITLWGAVEAIHSRKAACSGTAPPSSVGRVSMQLTAPSVAAPPSSMKCEP